MVDNKNGRVKKIHSSVKYIIEVKSMKYEAF